jgi:hypothetical protein
MPKSSKQGVRLHSQKRDTSHGDHAPASAIKPVPGAFGDDPEAESRSGEARRQNEGEGRYRPE